MMLKYLTALPLVLTVAALPSVAAAALVNGSFSPGFANWDGRLALFGAGAATDVDDPATEPDFFTATGTGFAELSFDTSASSYFVVELFQEFGVSDLGQPIEVELTWDWNPSSAADDTFQMVLRDGAGTAVNFVDDLFGNPPDCAAAGAATLRTDRFLLDGGYFSNPALTFSVLITDNDVDTTDTLTIGNVRIANAVPSPTPLLLLALGVLGIAAGCRRH
jgi:hypothetical protein